MVTKEKDVDLFNDVSNVEDEVPSPTLPNKEREMYGKFNESLVFKIESERDLHIKVVNFIERNFPNVLIVPTLGENQDTLSKRVLSSKKGYGKGSPDLLVLNSHNVYNGLVMEFKSPNGSGVLNENQMEMFKEIQK